MNESTVTQAVEAVDGTIIEQLTRSEVDMQVATAKRFPRSILQFKQDTLTMAISTPEIARSCFYVLPRGRKKIDGPSVRLAEIAAGAWGNLRCETRVVATEDRIVTAQATAWDMQRNVLIRCEMSRRITDKEGRRYNDDMIVMTGNAASSIAFRNAVFKIVPYVYIREIFLECKRIAATSNGGIDKAKHDWISLFVRQGISEDQVLDLLDKDSVEDMGLDDITTLQGLHTALSEGDTTLEQVFPEATLETGTKKFGFRRKPTSDKRKPARVKTTEPKPAQAETADAKPEPKPEKKPEPKPETAQADESNPWDEAEQKKASLWTQKDPAQQEILGAVGSLVNEDNSVKGRPAEVRFPGEDEPAAKKP